MTAMNDQLLRRVAAALTGVVHPGTGEDVVSSGHVRDLRVEEGGVVHFRFALRGEDPGSLVREARATAETVEGVERVRIDVGLPAAAREAGGGPGQASPQAPGQPLPRTAAQERSPLRPGSVPAPTPEPDVLPGVAHVIAVSSGKGGVGKSTVAVNLAVALAAEGERVGLLDADVYGPNVHTMLGEHRKPDVGGERGKEHIIPLEAHGVRIMSLGLLLEEDQPAVMRGPLISGILRQFVEQVAWGELDYLIVDMPPGTGDAQLSLVQTVEVDGAVMVTTPQEVATGDVLRAIRMFEKVGAPVLGLIENMSAFVCPCCGEAVPVFGEGGGARLAERAGIPLLGQVPLEVGVREGGDRGTPIVASLPESAAATALREIARGLLSRLAPAGPPA